MGQKPELKGERLRSIDFNVLTGGPRMCCYVEMPNKTTASGKMLFRCDSCGHETPAPSAKRCGRCAACGHHFGTLGHVLSCSELSEQENEALAKLRGLLDGAKAEDHLPARMRKLAAQCRPADAARLRKAANELDAAIELGAKAPKLVGAWARARKVFDELRKANP
jgi:hypothetical protein